MDEQQFNQGISIFEKESIGKLLVKFSVPAIISMVVNSIYNIVDQIFIGWGVGFLGNAATNVTFPLVTISLAVSALIADGCVAYFSLKLGEKNYEAAASTMGNGVMLSIVAGIALAAVGEIFMPGLIRLFGATEGVYDYAMAYGRITVLGAPLMCVSMSVSSLIRAEGNPRYAMFCMLAGCFANIVLDAWFVLGLGWGVAGAAWATVIGQGINCLIAILYIPRFKNVKFKAANMRLRLNVLRGFLPLGISSFFTQSAFAVVQICMNNQLVSCGASSIYGADIPLAAFGIVMKVNSIIVGVMVGLGVGSQPVVGYNYGARNFARVKKTFLYMITIGTVFGFLGWACFQLFPQSIVNIFGQESALYNEFAVKCFRQYLSACFLLGFLIPTGIFFQSIGKPIKALAATLSRSIVLFIPTMYILSAAWGLEGLLWTMPVSDTLSFFIILALAISEFRRMSKLSCQDDLIDA